MKQFDVLIIGAGAAGMMAARELAGAGKTVAVVEALHRTGGRMFGAEESGHLVEMGAEFVHGDLPLTKSLLREAGATLHGAEGSIWQHRNGKLHPQADFIENEAPLAEQFSKVENDMPVAEFLNRHFPETGQETLRHQLRNYVEGYFAADANRSSTWALCEDLTRDDAPQYRIAGGYRLLVRHLEAECRSLGVQFFTAQPVRRVKWAPGEVALICDEATFQGRQLLTTVSLGVLQSGMLAFEPELPAYQAAANALGYGHVVKINLLFRQPFWKEPRLTGGSDLHDLQFLFSKERIPTWWSQHPQQANLLTGWLGGPKAEALKYASHDELLQLALDALTRIFSLEPAYLWQDLLGAWSHNWSADPYFNGAYSYDVVDGAAHREVLLRPVADTLYFAGEALAQDAETGTVEAALQSGKEAAGKMNSKHTAV